MAGHTFKGFFSYTNVDERADPQLVKALTQTLEERVNVRFASDSFEIWHDTEGLRTGDRWDLKIEAALRASDMLIVLLTPKWLASKYCRKEYALFEDVERGLGDGEFVAPLLARVLEDEERHLTDEEKETWTRLRARQHKPISAIDFLKLSDNDRTVLIDRIAEDLVLMIGRRREKLGATPLAEAHELQQELSKANKEAKRGHQEIMAAVADERRVPQ